MAAFNYEHERRRLSETGLTQQQRTVSMQDQLWSLVAERHKTMNPFFLTIQQETVTARGFAHRGDLNNSYKKSVEEAASDPIAKRFALENQAFERAKKMMYTLPDYSTVMFTSPPPEDNVIEAMDKQGDEMKGYEKEKSMMYFYHILPGKDTKTKDIKALTVAHDFTKEEQAELLNTMMGTEVVKPTTESIILSPISNQHFGKEASTRTFRQLWGEVEDFYNKKQRNFFLPSVEEADEFLIDGEKARERRNQILSVMINDLARRVANGATEEEITRDWNIMLNLSDEVFNPSEKTHHSEIRSVSPEKVTNTAYLPSRATIFDQYTHLDYAPRVVATACGASGGLGVSHLITTQSANTTMIALSGSNGPVASSIGGRQEWFTCPRCNYKADGPVGDTCPKCKLTKEDYAKQSGQPMCA